MTSPMQNAGRQRQPAQPTSAPRTRRQDVLVLAWLAFRFPPDTQLNVRLGGDCLITRTNRCDHQRKCVSWRCAILRPSVFLPFLFGNNRDPKPGNLFRRRCCPLPASGSSQRVAMRFTADNSSSLGRAAPCARPDSGAAPPGSHAGAGSTGSAESAAQLPSCC